MPITGHYRIAVLYYCSAVQTGVFNIWLFLAGIQKWLDESKYRGDFADNYRHGQGRYYWPNGEVGYRPVDLAKQRSTRFLNSIYQFYIIITFGRITTTTASTATTTTRPPTNAATTTTTTITVGHGSGLVVKKTARKYLQQGGTKKSRFSTNISLYLGNDTIYGHSYNGRPIGNRMRSIEWCHL